MPPPSPRWFPMNFSPFARSSNSGVRAPAPDGCARALLLAPGASLLGLRASLTFPDEGLFLQTQDNHNLDPRVLERGRSVCSREFSLLRKPSWASDHGTLVILQPKQPLPSRDQTRHVIRSGGTRGIRHKQGRGHKPHPVSTTSAVPTRFHLMSLGPPDKEGKGQAGLWAVHVGVHSAGQRSGQSFPAAKTDMELSAWRHPARTPHPSHLGASQLHWPSSTRKQPVLTGADTYFGLSRSLPVKAPALLGQRLCHSFASQTSEQIHDSGFLESQARSPGSSRLCGPEPLAELPCPLLRPCSLGQQGGQGPKNPLPSLPLEVRVTLFTALSEPLGEAGLPILTTPGSIAGRCFHQEAQESHETLSLAATGLLQAACAKGPASKKRIDCDIRRRRGSLHNRRGKNTFDTPEGHGDQGIRPLKDGGLGHVARHHSPAASSPAPNGWGCLVQGEDPSLGAAPAND
ncbi:hypothetical protein Cadr_000020705 [Camelus dromedarius]|uniref:Uncharacterized protein n=1 Tax=Camelus dromedarius TaxID=9838 RepID=A0A5N4CZ31_CAMDR|nr:hypothetical protein Cadr_000020705 [Camelus dromedarius]